MNNIYIVISANGVGGTEKRMIGLWLFLIKKDVPVFLIISATLFETVIQIEEFQEINKYFNRIKLINFPNNKIRRLLVYLQLMWQSKKSIFHFSIFHPIFFYSNKVIYTLPTNSMSHYSLIGKVYIYLSILLAHKVDILDPKLYQKFKKIFWFKKNNIFLTSNSFVFFREIKRIPINERKDAFTFLGRFSKEKQVIRFVSSIEAVYKYFIEIHSLRPIFNIFGHGNLTGEIDIIIKKIDPIIKIDKKFSLNPIQELSNTKIYFSLQKHSNYPSKSLLEALFSGCLIIATDCGDTKLIANPDFSVYVPENFNQIDLIKAIKFLYALPAEERDRRSKAAVEFVKFNFSIERMSEYYLTLYKNK